MDRMLDDFGLSRQWGAAAAWHDAGAATWTPAVEVFHRNNELTIRAELPPASKGRRIEITESVKN